MTVAPIILSVPVLTDRCLVRTIKVTTYRPIMPTSPPILVFTMGGLVGIIGLYVVTLIVRTRQRSVKTGTDSMIGATVIASTPLQPAGRVDYKGENWTAVLDDPSTSVDPGTEVRIVAVEGLLVHVQPLIDRLSDSAPRYIEGS